eukprot:gene14652-biopygen1932
MGAPELNGAGTAQMENCDGRHRWKTGGSTRLARKNWRGGGKRPDGPAAQIETLGRLWAGVWPEPVFHPIRYCTGAYAPARRPPVPPAGAAPRRWAAATGEAPPRKMSPLGVRSAAVALPWRCRGGHSGTNPGGAEYSQNAAYYSIFSTQSAARPELVWS